MTHIPIRPPLSLAVPLIAGALLVVGPIPAARAGDLSRPFERLDSVEIDPTLDIVGFGQAIAAGDFDGDGDDDLAVGAPSSRIGAASQSGLVVEIETTPTGFVRRHFLDDRTFSDSFETPEDYDFFGETLAVGDFDGDGYDDLAIGVPREGITLFGEIPFAGKVGIVFGGPDGLDGSRHRTLFQSAGGSSIGAHRFFGSALAAGDFDGDGDDELAVGAPRRIGGDERGEVVVFDGRPGGPVPSGAQSWSQTDAGGPSDLVDLFGWALAAGDFDGDGEDDLAIGAPATDIGTSPNAGAITVLQGTSGGLVVASTSWPATFHRNTTGVDGAAAKDEYFGWRLAAGNYVESAYDDLIVGCRKPVVGWGPASLSRFLGTAAGLDPREDLTIDASDFPTGLAPDLDGPSAMALSDLDGDGDDDLLFANFLADDSAGGVWRLHGWDGPFATGSTLRVTPSPLASPTDGDYFGSSLAILRTPYRTAPIVAIGWMSASTGWVLLSSPGDPMLFGDGFESGDTSVWAASSP